MAGISAAQRDLDAVGAGLLRWHENRLPDATDFRISPLRANRSTGYSSESLMFEISYTNRGQVCTEDSVLRLPPAGGGLFPEYDLARQARVMEYLSSAGLPAPYPAHHEPDTSWLGSEFIVMPRISGRLPGDYIYPIKGWLHDAEIEVQSACYGSFVDVLVDLHNIDVNAPDVDVSFLARRGGLGLTAEIGWWSDYLLWATDGSPSPQMAEA